MLQHRLFLALANLGAILILLPALPLAYLAMLLTSTVAARFRKQTHPSPAADATEPRGTAPFRPPVTIVIPNWNGRDLLEKYLPSVVAACHFSSGDELIIVDNASSDGSAEFVRARYPGARLLSLSRNLGFGGGSNAGIRSATNRYVVLLNSDMRVEPDFLQPLLEPFRDPTVFAVAAQILFSDPSKRREESGLTYARWRNGELELGHDVQSTIGIHYPCFYPGGGSSAFDGHKLKAIGCFDHLFQPFYFEDTDLGFEAWKRGWKVYYAPTSIVYHEHRGTIGKKFSSAYINSIVAKNRILFHWKHINSAGRLASHCLRVFLLSCQSLRRPRGARVSGIAAMRALVQLPELLMRRWQSTRSARFGDRLALDLHRPDVFHDHLLHRYQPGSRLKVLFLSPYPIYPPHHGGAVLMSQTLRYLAALCDVHLVVMLEDESEREAHLAEASRFASLHLLVRPPSTHTGRFSASPSAVREFASAPLRALLHRLLYEERIDVVQIEYTNMAQYTHRYRSVLTALFEHDVYFQSVGRRLLSGSSQGKLVAFLEYLRAMRYELKALARFDYVQVCTQDNATYLASFQPALLTHMDSALRAGIEVASYRFAREHRDPDTVLFIGNFRHTPNREGLGWLLDHVMPALLRVRPKTRLRVVGPNQHLLPLPQPLPEWLQPLGAVDDVRPHLEQCALFACPVLSGSGVRVKLLEAFSAGIPVVSTAIGAEGLLYRPEPVCAVADTPEEFVAAVLQLMRDPAFSDSLAHAARALVEQDWDAARNTRQLVARYHQLLAAKQGARNESKSHRTRESATGELTA